LVVLVACLCSVNLAAQVTSGTIFGTVKDPAGAMVAGATVTAHAEAIGVTRTVTTSSTGDFVFPNLPPATYSLIVEAKGFKKLESQGVFLSAADKLNAGELVLGMGGAAETVTVTADAAQLQLQANSGERSDLISGQQLNNVAINGRNVLDYMKLIPGVTSTWSGSFSGTGGIDGFNINGTRSNQHEYTIDGASNVDTGNNGGTHVTLNPDAIAEVKVLTSNYQAEFGKAAGGQIAIVTKSGTNQWHGNARFFHRHEGLNANEWFSKQNQGQLSTPRNSPALYRYNDIGYQIGGPIWKDKLFAFWSEEFYKQLLPGGTQTFYVPTDLERDGDFSQSINGDGRPIVISGPGITSNKITPTPAQQAVFDQVKLILKLFPKPNANGFGVSGQNYNYVQALSADRPRREDILRVDYQLNSRNRLYGRWIHNSETATSPFMPFPGPFGIFACSSVVNFPGGCTQKHPGWNFSANLVSTITSTLLNEFSVGPSHTLSIVDGSNGNISLAKNGIKLPLLYKSDTIPDMSFNGLDNVNFGGGYLGATPWHQANTTINVNDNLSWVRGKHTIKGGMFYQRNRKDQVAWGNINGQLNFDVGPTGGGTCPSGPNTCKLGDPLASALIGAFNGFSQSTARPVGKFRYNQLEFYVQDTWKITPRLTLDYGMRFAWIPPQYDADNQIGLFDPALYNPADAVKILPWGAIDTTAGGNPLNGMRYSKDGTLPEGGWNGRGIMPEPRFGFAYDVFSHHKTVLRGGVGMMHDRVQGNLIYNTVFNNPAVVKTANVAAGNIANLPTMQSDFGAGVLGNILGADRSGQVPTVYSFSFGLQQEIAKGTTFDLAYVGTLSRHLVTSRDINAIPYGTAFTAAAQDPGNFTDYCNAHPGVCVNGLPPVEPNLAPAYAAAGFKYSGAYAYGHQAYSNAPLVPFKGYDQISYLKFDGTSNYNSLQASLQRRFSKGLTFGAVYTWSKALTTANSDQDTQDPFQPRLFGYRTAGWDRAHVLAANYIYDLPNVTKHFGGPTWLSYLTDNFQLSGVTQFMSGTPADLGSWNGEPGALDGGNMWGAIPYFYTVDTNGNAVLGPVGSRIRATRDRYRNGGMQNWDMSLLKNIKLGSNEERYIQLRLEAFNVFNHPNFDSRNYGIAFDGPWEWTYPGQAGGGSGTPNFSIARGAGWGSNTSTLNNGGGPGGFRVLQLGAKIYF
jgi:hypothetical protein